MEKTVHKNCNFYNETKDVKKQCTALTERICNYKKCNFFLTREEFIKKQKKGVR